MSSPVGSAPPDAPGSGGPFGLDDDRAAQKQFFEGTHRLVPPARTLERMRGLMPVMGVTRLAGVTGLDRIGLPVAMSIRPNARSLAVSSGKGLTEAAALASALMEAIELYHAERVRLPLLLGTHRELRHAHALADVGRLPSLSLSRFHDDFPLLWVAGWDLLDDAPCLVPFEMVHANFTWPLPAGSGGFPMTSNGLASGNHVLEAISHGICEVVERDATTLWRTSAAARRAGRGVDLHTVDDDGCRTALERYDRAGVAVGVWDITSDVGVPTFECVVVDRESHAWRPAYATSGVGCHPAKAVALLRALTEAAQGRLIYITGARDDRDRQAYASACDPHFAAAVRDRIARQSDRCDFRGLPDYQHAGFAAEVRWLLARLVEAGIDQVIVVDLRRPEFRVPVVRVVIPGLEGISDAPGYAPGPRARALA